MSDDISRLEENLAKVRDAVLTACGADGKNGRLSRLDKDVTDLTNELSSLRKLLWGLAVTLVLSFAGTGVKSCVDSAQRDTTYELKIKQLEAAVTDIGRRLNP